jgi:hypothetical protein
VIAGHQFKTNLGRKKNPFRSRAGNDFWVLGRQLVDGDILRLLQFKLGKSNPQGYWITTDDLNSGR